MVKFKRNYPKVILTSEEKQNIEALRGDLSAHGIYAHYAKLAEFPNITDDDGADIALIYSPEYSSRASELYSSLCESEKHRTVIYIGNESDIDKREKSYVFPVNNSLVCSEIVRIFKEEYRLDPAVGEDDEIFCELGKPPQVYYNGTKIALSKSESKIVHFLLTIEPRSLASKEDIGDYLSLAAGAVPVHIHNINDKSMQAYHDKLIFSRSSRGYFVY